MVAALVASRSELGQRARTLACSFGLLTACAMGVHVSGGVTEAHFSFFVVVMLLTLYEDWTVFVLAVLYTLLHHGLLGTFAPEEVFAAHAGSPWGWATIHAIYVAAAGAAGVVAWRLNEDVRHRMRATQEELRNAAMTDSLTGLPNRRRLTSDLETAVEDGHGRLAMFDLDGFKGYNDTFGHLAGDALLTRLGHRLRESVADSGTAYRLGGDEFCVLATGPTSAATIEAAAEALAESGGAFTIGNSHGTVVLDQQVRKPEDALRIADQRMYERKNGGRRSAGDQSKTVLVRALSERHPDLSSHSADVSRTAELVARELDVAEDQLEPIRHAAELHDVGKVGIPDAILEKPGKLDPDEWAFMRRHTIIGERIVAGRTRARPREPPGALEPRALGRRGLSRRAQGRGDPHRRPDHRGLRLLRRNAVRPPLHSPLEPRAMLWPSSGAARAPSSIRQSSRRSARSWPRSSPPTPASWSPQPYPAELHARGSGGIRGFRSLTQTSITRRNINAGLAARGPPGKDAGSDACESTRATEDAAARRCPAAARWRGPESNRRHHDFQSCALPTELPRQARAW